MTLAKKQKNAIGFTPKPMRSRKKKGLLFYSLMIALPILQFCIFYIGVNFNSILLAFSEHAYHQDGGGYTSYFTAGFDNFAKAFDMLKAIDGWELFTNSLLMIVCELGISLPLAVIFSFYVYKKYHGSKLFKVVLFMPQIVSVMVFSILFKYISNDVVTEFAIKAGNAVLADGGFLNNPNKLISLATIIFYNIWISFGVNVVMITGSMSSINPSLVEASQLDGCSPIREFWHVTLPLVWPTFTTFVVVSLTGLFVNQMNLYSLFSSNADVHVSSLGYQLFIASQDAGLDKISAASALHLTYYELSALGLTFTLILLPIVMTVRYLMRKLGPKVD